jgi:hypothetical protein
MLGCSASRTASGHMSEARPKRVWRLVVAVLLFAVMLSCIVWSLLAKRRAQSEQCSFFIRNNLGLIARVWAGEHGHKMPTNYDCMKYCVVVMDQPRFWVCPADTSNPMAAERDWSRFRAEQASYEIVSPGIADTDTNAVFFRCKIHGHVCYVDGSVFDGVRRRWPDGN